MSKASASGPLQTALQCFAAVARHHGVDLAIERLTHDHALTGAEDPIATVLAVAQANGFRAKSAELACRCLSGPGVSRERQLRDRRRLSRRFERSRRH
jgi:ABC-type bacteriocin/lantibiotic exporter with double-glycine peptidase domain